MEQLGSRRSLAAAVDGLWFTEDGQLLVVHAGVWIYALSVSPTGIAVKSTRLLEPAPAAVHVVPDGKTAVLLSRTGGSRPSLTSVELASPWAPPVQEPADSLRARLESQLNLTLNPWGEPQPLQQF